MTVKQRAFSLLSADTLQAATAIADSVIEAELQFVLREGILVPQPY